MKISSCFCDQLLFCSHNWIVTKLFLGHVLFSTEWLTEWKLLWSQCWWPPCSDSRPATDRGTGGEKDLGRWSASSRQKDQREGKLQGGQIQHKQQPQQTEQTRERNDSQNNAKWHQVQEGLKTNVIKLLGCYTVTQSSSISISKRLVSGLKLSHWNRQ